MLPKFTLLAPARDAHADKSIDQYRGGSSSTKLPVLDNNIQQSDAFIPSTQSFISRNN